MGTMAAHKLRWLLAWVISLSVMPALLSGCESVTSGTPREVEAAAEREQDWHPSAQEGRWQAHMDAGIDAYVDGDYAEAAQQFATAVGKAEAFGEDDPRLAQSLNGQAEVYRAQGRYADAEPLHQRALAIYEKALGPEHPSVATSLNNLASLYQAQGQYTQAEPLYQRALGIREKALGPEHPLVANILENYAALLREMSPLSSRLPWSKATKLEARARAIRAKHIRKNPRNPAPECLERRGVPQKIRTVGLGNVVSWP